MRRSTGTSCRGDGGRRAGSDRAAKVSSVPGAIAADVNTTLARDTSPRRTLAQANDRRRSRAASSSAASVAARARLPARHPASCPSVQQGSLASVVKGLRGRPCPVRERGGGESAARVGTVSRLGSVARPCRACMLRAGHAARARRLAARPIVKRPALCMVGTGVPNSAARSTASRLDHAEAEIPARQGRSCLPAKLRQQYGRRRGEARRRVEPHRCGTHGHGCGAAVDAYGDHHAACPRTGLLARRAKPLEHAWVRIAREAAGPAASTLHRLARRCVAMSLSWCL